MTVSDDKERIVAYVDKQLLAQMDQIADELGISRSSMIAACIESGLDDWRFFRFLGLTPRRMAALKKVIDRFQRRGKQGKGSEAGLDTP